MNDNVVQFPTANERLGVDERQQMRELVSRFDGGKCGNDPH